MKRILKTICDALATEWQAIRDERYVKIEIYDTAPQPRHRRQSPPQ